MIWCRSSPLPSQSYSSSTLLVIACEGRSSRMLLRYTSIITVQIMSVGKPYFRPFCYQFWESRLQGKYIQELIIFLYFFIVIYSICLILTQVRNLSHFCSNSRNIKSEIHQNCHLVHHFWSKFRQNLFNKVTKLVFPISVKQNSNIAAFPARVSLHSPWKVRCTSAQGISNYLF